MRKATRHSGIIGSILRTRLAIYLPVLLIVAVFFGRTDFHYSEQCVKCLRKDPVAQKRVLAVPVWSRRIQGDENPSYQRIFGEPCGHSFSKWDWGMGPEIFSSGIIRTGKSGDEAFLSSRISAVREAFAAFERTGDRDLATRTFALIDRWVPPASRANDRASVPDIDRARAAMLALGLRRATSPGEWQEVIERSESTIPGMSPP